MSAALSKKQSIKRDKVSPQCKIPNHEIGLRLSSWNVCKCKVASVTSRRLAKCGKLTKSMSSANLEILEYEILRTPTILDLLICPIWCEVVYAYQTNLQCI